MAFFDSREVTSCSIFTPFCGVAESETERERECRRKAVRHDGGTGFRHAVDSLLFSLDFLQLLRRWLTEWYVVVCPWDRLYAFDSEVEKSTLVGG